MCFRIIEVSGIASTISTSTMLATSIKDLSSIPPPPSSLHSVPGMTVGARFRLICCLMLLHTKHVVRARLLDACSPGSSDWPDVLPLVERTTEIVRCNDPYCCWSSPWCSGCATSPMYLWLDRHSGWASRPGRSARLRPTYQTQPAQRSTLPRFHTHSYFDDAWATLVVRQWWKVLRKCRGREVDVLRRQEHVPNTFALSYVHASSTLAGCAVQQWRMRRIRWLPFAEAISVAGQRGNGFYVLGTSTLSVLNWWTIKVTFT